jgi:hypothetical protein
MNALLGFLLFVVLAVGGCAQRGPGTLTPEESARLERLRDEFEHLSPVARRKLLERAYALRERERSLERELTPELKKEVDDPEQGRGRWRNHVRERFKESGRKLYEKLPAPLKKRLEEAPPAERRALLERLLAEREHVGARLGRRFFERHGLSSEDLRHFEALPPLERLRRLHELEKRERRERRERKRESV